MTVRIAILTIGLTLTGLFAGGMAVFSYAVMPALARTDDETLVTTMRRVNEAILNPLFLVIFLGGLILTAIAAWQYWGSGAAGWLITASAALSLIGIAITVAGHVPLNSALANTEQTFAAARQAFESRWLALNAIRSIALTASLATGVLGAALAAGGAR
ncbi:putative membrane protein [Naumannella cuiyingiana]|uniref:Putative membrane protein n=1 Tax=Naumannella cuiyingiana TaxID=1347891 RepID=A0A7Z0IKX4_9ACTN|nr:anthrone oxygenase family protein [Naumannella cuiyingiana]NYI70983.1 putative membrane protein [Naumannella cuiyingiana]